MTAIKTSIEVFGEGYKSYGELGLYNPYISTSVHSDLFELGRVFAANGWPMPQKARKSTGDSYVVDGMKFKASYSRQGATSFVRIHGVFK